MSKKTVLTVFISALAGMLLFVFALVGYGFYLDKTGQQLKPVAVATSAQPVIQPTPSSSFDEPPPWEIERSPWETEKSSMSEPKPRVEKPWYEKLKKPDIGGAIFWLIGFLLNMVAWAWVLNLVALLCWLFHWDVGAEFFDTPWESLKAIVDNDPTSIPTRNWPIWTGVLAIAAGLSLWIGNPIWKVLVTLFWLIVPWILFFGVLKIISLTKVVLFWLGVPWDVMAKVLGPLFTAASEIGKVQLQKQTKRLSPSGAAPEPTSEARIGSARADVYEMAVAAIREAREAGQPPPAWALSLVSHSGSHTKKKTP
jgi:hypothetical protein